MNDFEMTLNSPLTSEDWAKITDKNMEHTQSVTFQTEGDKKAEFVKVVRCKDCKWSKPATNGKGQSGYGCTKNDNPAYETFWWLEGDWYCADGERKDT